MTDAPDTPADPLKVLMEAHGKTTPNWEYRNGTIESPVAGSFALWQAVGGFKRPEDGRFAALAHNLLPAIAQRDAEREREIRQLRTKMDAVKRRVAEFIDAKPMDISDRLMLLRNMLDQFVKEVP